MKSALILASIAALSLFAMMETDPAAPCFDAGFSQAYCKQWAASEAAKRLRFCTTDADCAAKSGGE